MSRASADVIVALGGGVSVDGEPAAATVARARRAVALYRSGRAQRIVMSGAYGMYDPQPPVAEATLMAQIAFAAGVPPGDLCVEAQSRTRSATSGSPSRSCTITDGTGSSW